MKKVTEERKMITLQRIKGLNNQFVYNRNAKGEIDIERYGGEDVCIKGVFVEEFVGLTHLAGYFFGHAKGGIIRATHFFIDDDRYYHTLPYITLDDYRHFNWVFIGKELEICNEIHGFSPSFTWKEGMSIYQIDVCWMDIDCRYTASMEVHDFGDGPEFQAVILEWEVENWNNEIPPCGSMHLTDEEISRAYWGDNLNHISGPKYDFITTLKKNE